jgi:hypothetical protein
MCRFGLATLLEAWPCVTLKVVGGGLFALIESQREMGGGAAVEPSTVSAWRAPPSPSVRWGVLPGPALWPTVLRLLFVLDGRISTSGEEHSFGLKFVLDTLHDDSFAWWVRYEVDVVRRDCGSRRISPPASEYPEKLNFRFTDSNFNLDSYDQVWFFGDHPSNFPGDIYDDKWSPLTDPAELKLLAEWMDRGGGVFAAGDHFNLGASMCSRIPRVRTMRKWTEAQGVPPQHGDYRNETLQREPGTTEDHWEGDGFAQPVELVYRSQSISIIASRLVPHPLFCAPTGLIDHFPDHMHEGEVIEDYDVELDKPLGIPGYDEPEYPFEDIDVSPGGGVEQAAPEGVVARSRPRPHVVAYGRTTNRRRIPLPLPPATHEPTVSVSSGTMERFGLWGGTTARFGLVSTYDGDLVGLGRVVVDSTWHHWFTYNLYGFRAHNPAVYAMMQAYYRNVGLWLATPAQRRSMLIAATWGTVVSDPMAFPPASEQSLWGTGRRALDVIGRTMNQCTLLDLAGAFLGGRADQIFGVPPDVDPSDPCPGCIPAELGLQAIVGGIASSLIAPAIDYLQAPGKDRRLLDPDAIATRAAEGAERGRAALLEVVRSSGAAADELVGLLQESFRPLRREPIPVEFAQLRVVAERLQLPDLTDPALAEDSLALTLDVHLGGARVARVAIEDLEVPTSRRYDVVVDLDRVLYDGPVQSGESLGVEVVAGVDDEERIAPERLRFSETLTGAHSTWIGRHVPHRGQPWRLWYRIETF